jgi:hypothetical protein
MKKDSAVSVEKQAEFQDERAALLRRGAQQPKEREGCKIP